MTSPSARRIVVVLKGYPRLSETFIAQELRGLELAGFDLTLVSMRRPTDGKRHPVHDEIKAPVHYLPEYLHEEPFRVLKALRKVRRWPSFRRAFSAFLRDLRHDVSRNRFRRFGQAAVLAAEWPEGGAWLHAHFIHTPASVTAYASLLTGIPWTCSAHAKDIWTSGDRDLQGKLEAARWTVTCNDAGYGRLKSLIGQTDASDRRVWLSYHGLDLARFAPFTGARSDRDGSAPGDPVKLLCVCRAVAKKGLDVLLAALARLPPDLNWSLVHIGGGDAIAGLKAEAKRLGIASRIEWRGALAQEDVLAQYQQADLFVLASRIAADGDRDGLPNVLVEASSQGLACVSTRVAGIVELITDGETGLLVEPDDPEALARALERGIRDPSLRQQLGANADRRVRAEFDHRSSIALLGRLFTGAWETTKS